MALPEIIRVKLSSEGAEAISITPVVARDMPTRELVELMLAITGKDSGRLKDLLLRGTLVSGASRFRWVGWEAERADIETMLATFPDPDPLRSFDAGRCGRVILRGSGFRLELPRRVAEERRFLRRRSYWDAIVESLAEARISYVDYSYRERADVFRAQFAAPGVKKLRESANLLKYVTLARQVESTLIESADLLVER
jgi:hypothetical protein